MKRARFAPGDTAHIRVINGSSERIEKKWISILYGRARYLIDPGGSLSCVEIPISEEWTPGRYRVLEEVSVPDDSGKEDTLTIAVPFRVGA